MPPFYCFLPLKRRSGRRRNIHRECHVRWLGTRQAGGSLQCRQNFGSTCLLKQQVTPGLQYAHVCQSRRGGRSSWHGAAQNGSGSCARTQAEGQTTPAAESSSSFRTHSHPHCHTNTSYTMPIRKHGQENGSMALVAGMAWYLPVPPSGAARNAPLCRYRECHSQRGDSNG